MSEKQSPEQVIESGKIEVIELGEPFNILTKFENKGFILQYQLEDSSKKTIVDQVTDNVKERVRQFLEENGHTTLVGNFGKINKKSFGGKGAVKGVMAHFPALKNGMEVKLLVTHIVYLNDGEDLVAVRIQKVDPDTVLREDLPQDCGLSPELYEGMSHVTCYVNKEKGLKPVNSNNVLAKAFPKE